MTYFEWSEVTKEVEKIAGKEVRNWAEKSFDSLDPNHTKPYQDFWHELIDYTEIHNDCYLTLDFLEMIEYYESEEEKSWVADILKIYHTVVGMDEATFHIWW